MKIKININGKEVEIKLTDEQVKSIKEQTDKKYTGYERKKQNNMYNFVGLKKRKFIAHFDDDIRDSFDESAFDNANYFTDSQIAEDRAKLFNILNAMYKWAAENTEPITFAFENKKKAKWTAIFDTNDKCIRPGNYIFSQVTILPYFETERECGKFIRQFSLELTWLFTEFEYRLKDERGDRQ